MLREIWYWYTFEDGSRQCVKGMSAVELAAEKRKHGELVLITSQDATPCEVVPTTAEA